MKVDIKDENLVTFNSLKPGETFRFQDSSIVYIRLAAPLHKRYACLETGNTWELDNSDLPSEVVKLRLKVVLDDS